MIITTPPWAQKQTFQKSATSQGVQILFTEHPFESDKFLVTIQDEKQKIPILIKDLMVMLFQEEKGLGPLILEVEKRFEGGYVFSKSVLSPPGLWKLEIVSRRLGAYDAVASFQVDYLGELERSRIDPGKRTFGLFEVIILGIGLGLMVLSIDLYNFSRNLNETYLDLRRDGMRNRESDFLQAQSLLTRNQNRFPGSLPPSGQQWFTSLLGLAIVSLLIWGLPQLESFEATFNACANTIVTCGIQWSQYETARSYHPTWFQMYGG